MLETVIRTRNRALVAWNAGLSSRATANDFGLTFHETRREMPRQTPRDVLYDDGRVVNYSPQCDHEPIKDYHVDLRSTLKQLNHCEASICDRLNVFGLVQGRNDSNASHRESSQASLSGSLAGSAAGLPRAIHVDPPDEAMVRMGGSPRVKFVGQLLDVCG